MADYRQIHTSIWDDDWFCQLSNDEKIVFIWLFSNRRASVSGIYEFSEFICSRETGVDLDGVKSAIQRLIADQKIMIEEKWVWVKNLRKYNDSKSPNSNKRILSDLLLLPDNGMKKAYLAYYQSIVSPLPTPTKPLDSPLPTHTDDLLEHEQEHEQDQLIKATDFPVLLGVPWAEVGEMDEAEDIIKNYKSATILSAGAWVKGTHKSSMRTAIKALRTTLREGNWNAPQKSNGNGNHGKPPRKDDGSWNEDGTLNL